MRKIRSTGKKILLPCVLSAAFLLNACGSSGESVSTSVESITESTKSTEASESESAESAETENGDSTVSSVADASEMFTERDYKTDYDEASAVKINLSDENSETTDEKAVTISGSTITIKDEGCYILSGSLKDGQIIIDAEKTDKVQIVLNGVQIENTSSAAIYVKQADKVFITLADGTENTLVNSGEYVQTDDNTVDAVIFSKDDLTLNGLGSLNIRADYGSGVVSKDDLVITSGTYTVVAAEHALSGKDSVRIADGQFTLSSGEDGIHSSNSEDEGKGFVYISGGEIQIAAGDDGIHAETALTITDGEINITESEEGLEGLSVDVTGGNISIVSRDDGINAAQGSGTSQDTEMQESFEKDGHMQGQRPEDMGERPEMNGSDVNAEEMRNQEFSAEQETIPNEMPNRNQDGFGGGPGGGPGGGGEDPFAVTEGAYISISGGKITISAEGDGIDSNGDLYISGGEIYVLGPTNDGNASLDYNGEAVISGGTIVAAGSSGMAQNFSDGTQGSMLVTVSTQSAGSEIVLVDEDGNELIRFTPDKEYSCVIISTPDITEGKTYQLSTGSETTEVVMDSLIYGSGGMGGGFGGRGMGEHPRDFGQNGDQGSKMELQRENTENTN